MSNAPLPREYFRVVERNPEHIGNISYIYDAVGTKLKKVVTDASSLITTEYAGNYVYENGVLQFFNHAEGYFDVTNTPPSGELEGAYVYQYKDHLGNVRLSYADSNGDGVITATGTGAEIREENNFYPFGLKHKGYNNVVTSTNPAQKFKYNGVEYEESLGLNMYEMSFRQYDPAIGRFTSIDPVTHYSMSTYTAFDNNPVFWADPSGANGEHYDWVKKMYVNDKGQKVSFATAMASVGLNTDGSEKPDDNITVNSKGIVTKVDSNDKPNRFFDENGNELFFNDNEGVDGQYTEGKWFSGDRVFYPLTIEQTNSQIIKSGLIYERLFANSKFGYGQYYLSLFKAFYYSNTNYDFAENYLIFLSKERIPSSNTLISQSRTSYVDGTAFFRFGNTNNIYNLYDAGNYMWGRAMNLSGFTYDEARNGSLFNQPFSETDADQRAIKNGFYGN